MSDIAQANPMTIFDRSQYIRALFNEATPAPYAVRRTPDVESEDTGYYISGAPNSKVVADNLSLSDAILITYLLNQTPDLLVEVGYISQIVTSADASSLLDVVRLYQEKIGQLTGDPAPIPAVKTAADLSFLHVGCILFLGSDNDSLASNYRIHGVSNSPFDDTVEVLLGNDRTLVLLPDMPITVRAWVDYEGPQVSGSGEVVSEES